MKKAFSSSFSEIAYTVCLQHALLLYAFKRFKHRFGWTSRRKSVTIQLQSHEAYCSEILLVNYNDIYFTISSAVTTYRIVFRQDLRIFKRVLAPHRFYFRNDSRTPRWGLNQFRIRQPECSGRELRNLDVLRKTNLSVTWNRFRIKKIAYELKPPTYVETSYLNIDICKIESLQTDEGRAQSADSSKAYSKLKSGIT